MDSSASTEPYLILDSKFVRSAQRHGLSHRQLTQIALGFNRGTKLQALSQQTCTTRAMLRWLHRLAWRAALVIPYAAGGGSTRIIRCGPLSTTDHASIQELHALKVRASDIATYLGLPVALVTNSLRQRVDQEFAPDEPTVSHVACLAG